MLKKSSDLTFVTEMWLLHEIKLDILHANFQRITFLCVVQKSPPIIDRQRLTFKASNQLWGLGDLLNCLSFHLQFFTLPRAVNQAMDFWSISPCSLAYTGSLLRREQISQHRQSHCFQNLPWIKSWLMFRVGKWCIRMPSSDLHGEVTLLDCSCQDDWCAKLKPIANTHQERQKVPSVYSSSLNLWGLTEIWPNLYRMSFPTTFLNTFCLQLWEKCSVIFMRPKSWLYFK